MTEQLKAENGLEWMRQMNNIRACAMELVNENHLQLKNCNSYNRKILVGRDKLLTRHFFVLLSA